MSIAKADNRDYRYALLQIADSRFGKTFRELPSVDRFEVEKIALKQCEIQRRVLGSPEAARVAIPADRVEKEYQSIVSRYSGREQFERELEENGLDAGSFSQLIERNLRVEAVMDYVGSQAEPCTEISARLYYYMNTDKFQHPQLRKARHILITINPDFPENQRNEVIKRATTIAERLKNKPARFAEQAQKYSECPTAMNGGELGSVKKGVLFPSLDKALFQMKAGEVSDIIESPLGFHILKCDAIQPEGFVPESQALPTIIEKLTERNRKNHQRNWLKQLFEAG